jgi:hypothetical protein
MMQEQKPTFLTLKALYSYMKSFVSKNMTVGTLVLNVYPQGWKIICINLIFDKFTKMHHLFAGMCTS